MNKDLQPDIQLTSNVVIVNDNNEVLLTRYDPDDERWWIPGASLEPYEHPDAAARRALTDVGQNGRLPVTMNHVESFRGRRGWHVMFNYLVRSGPIDSAAVEGHTRWFPLDSLPAMTHGEWERTVIAHCVGASA